MGLTLAMVDNHKWVTLMETWHQGPTPIVIEIIMKHTVLYSCTV